MKKLFILSLLALATITSNAQDMYMVTGNNVNVRKGPGRNYGAITYPSFEGYDIKWQLSKSEGAIVRYLGKKRNGFMFVEAEQPNTSGFHCSYFIVSGWVPAQYLKLMTKKCPRCKGMGILNRPCDSPTHPAACTCNIPILVTGGRGYYNKKICDNCNGIGYLR